MEELGKGLLALAALLAIIGAVMIFAGRAGVPLGKLPGDLHWQSRSGNTQLYFPLATSIVLSVLLTLLLWLVRHFRR
jgi:hypothetical protein